MEASVINGKIIPILGKENMEREKNSFRGKRGTHRDRKNKFENANSNGTKHLYVYTKTKELIREKEEYFVNSEILGELFVFVWVSLI